MPFSLYLCYSVFGYLRAKANFEVELQLSTQASLLANASGALNGNWQSLFTRYASLLARGFNLIA